MSRSYKLERLERYTDFPDHLFREAVHDLAVMIRDGMGQTLPSSIETYLTYCAQVRTDIPEA